MQTEKISVKAIEGSEEDKLFKDWKKHCLNLYGAGGIKKRMVELVKKDLEDKI